MKKILKKILKKFISIKNDNDKMHIILTLFGIKLKFCHKNYTLNSGERQTAIDIKDIRKDHLNRYEFAINTIKNLLNINSQLKGLDCFCGNGYGSWLIANSINTAIDSIDGSKEAIKCAKKFYKNPKINYFHKLFPFKLKNNYYDFVISFESVEHIKDDILFLKNLYATLKENGVLLVSTPNIEKNDLSININPFHYRHYNNNQFIELTKTIGFKLVEMYGQDTYIINDKKMVCGILSPEKMDIKKDYNGQFSIYVFKK